MRHVLDSAEQFDPRSQSAGSWQAPHKRECHAMAENSLSNLHSEALPRLSRERCAAAAVAVRRRLLVLGGCDEATEN